ncbi:MAG TPA: hypothetical protein GXZ40_04545 [Bacteroidales bacterium]|nr:hypothetical protein [Bacteroidales bacterium]
MRRLGGKPARAEAAGGAAAKKRACKLFLPPCVPTACARGLGTGRRPRASARGHALKKNKNLMKINLIEKYH